jgi:small subunit ribosomal protein S6
MSNYEWVAIVRQDVSSTQAEQIASDIQEMITSNSGTVAKHENWGLRPFAYRIRKNRKGHYLYFEAIMGSEGVNEVDRRLKLHEDILRHQVVRIETFIEGPSAVMLSRQREERAASEGAGSGGYGSRDEGYRPRARYQDDNAA